MDFDGDTIATVDSDIIYNAVEWANVHTIRLVKDRSGQIVQSSDGEQNVHPSQKQEETFKINNHRRIMEVNRLGFSNNIGEVTNKVTVLWCMYAGAETEEEKALLRDYIKIMSVVNQLIVDYVKTGIKVPIPKEIKDKIKGIKKPMFMKFKKQAASDDDKIASNADRFSFVVEERAEEEGISPEEYINIRRNFALANCTVDKFYIYLKEQFEGIKTDFYSTGNDFCFAELIKNTPNKYTLTYKAVKNKLADLLEMHKQICGEKYYEEKNNIASDSDRRFDSFYSYYSYCETELTRLCHNREKLLEYVIYQFYTEKEFVNCDKSILWNVFGEDICEIYRTGNINTSPEKIAQLEKKRLKAEKNAEKVKALRKGSTIVSIKDLPEGEITITDTEVGYISDIVEENQTYLRLAIVLLALYRKINLENVRKPKPINLEKGLRNKITSNQLCKLSDIYHRQFNKGLKYLAAENLIHIDINSLKTPKISVNMPRLEKTVKEYTIKDINEVGEIFSDQNISAS
ncbi:MAG: hypothetical protein LUG24_00505 [Clostridiales bacterium]|nr:hypothetical protein [Clostridiales bacterium]